MRGSSFGYLMKQGIKNIYVNRVMSFAAIGVLVACMLLIGSALLFSLNVNGIIGSVEDQNKVVMFIKMDATEEEKATIEKQIKAVSNINKITYITGKEALEKWKIEMEENSVLFDGLEQEKILPDTYEIMLDDLSKLNETTTILGKIEGIDKINAPVDVAKTITNMKSAVYVCGMVIVSILIAVSIVIIGNTIKITVFNRRKEINIMKMVGATDTFIRLPFFFEGFFLGLISATIAFFLLWGGYEYVIKWLSENSITLSTTISFQSNAVPFKSIAKELYIGLVAGGTIIGTGGSIIFVRKHLKV